MSKGNVYIVGASGHGKVVASTLVEAGYSLAGFVDDNPSLIGRQWFDYPVLGLTSVLSEVKDARAVIAIGDATIRRRLAEHFQHVQWERAVHPAAWVDKTVEIGEGSVVFAGAVIQPGAKIGKHCIINTGATVDHDCCLGDYVHVCPGVNLAGDVMVDDGAWLGIGCQVIQGIRIGEGVMVGAGATVIRDVPDHVVAIGTPARVV